jgi:hypothetical protein
MLRESKGLRYLWVEAPPEVPLSPFSSQYVLILLPGTSGRGTAQGTARAPNYTGCFDQILVYFRYHGRYLRPRYRSCTFPSNLNHPFTSGRSEIIQL